MNSKIQTLIFALALLLGASIQLQAQGTAFTYQGRLNYGANPANGTYDLRFEIFDLASGGSQAGQVLTNSATSVSNGLFTITLDFGANVFTNTDRFLEIAVRSNGVSSFTTLSSRQKLTPAPYAIFAENVGIGGLSAGAYGNAVTFNNTANSFSGSFNGNGATISNVNALTLGGVGSNGFWRTAGNAGTTPGANFLGTTDNQALEIKVNGSRVLRLEPTTNGTPNIIGGSAANSVAAGVSGATLSGGLMNRIDADAFLGFIGGGQVNEIHRDAYESTIGGGYRNTIETFDSTIGGGASNTIQTNSQYSTIAGGTFNRIFAGASLSAIGGGSGNLIESNAQYSTIPGGVANTAGGQSSFAAGYRAQAMHDGTFVWADSQEANFTSTASNQFLIRASGGVGIGTVNPQQLLQLNVTAGHGEGMRIDSDIAGHSPAIYLNHTGTGGRNFRIASFGDNLNPGSFRIRDDTAGTDRFVIDAGGRVEVNGGISIFDGFFKSLNAGIATEVNARLVNFGINDGPVNRFGGTYTAASQGGFFRLDARPGVPLFSFHGRPAGTNVEASQLGYITSSGTVRFEIGANQKFSLGSSGTFEIDSSGATAGRFLVNDSGNVGIGATNLTGALFIRQPTGVPAAGMNAQDNGLGIGQYSTSSYKWIQSYGGPLVLNPVGNNVGIGKTNPATALDVNGTVTAIAFNPPSDRNMKENFSAISALEVLDKVAALPINRWNFKGDAATPHVGPMAQDFYAAFGVGLDDKHIATVDADGVALAAIQGLNEKVETRSQKSEDRIQKLESENLELRRELETLKRAIGSLADSLNGGIR